MKTVKQMAAEYASRNWQHVDGGTTIAVAAWLAGYRKRRATDSELMERYDHGYDDGRSMILHEFKKVCDQRDVLLAEVEKLRAIVTVGSGK